MSRVAVVFVLVSILGCTVQRSGTTESVSNEIVVGGLYATKGDDGQFRITKVLAVDSQTVHLRLYAEKFDELPDPISSIQLTLGNAFDGGPVGLGHFPIHKDSFFIEPGEHLKTESVEESELDGYRLYLESN